MFLRSKIYWNGRTAKTVCHELIIPTCIHLDILFLFLFVIFIRVHSSFLSLFYSLQTLVLISKSAVSIFQYFMFMLCIMWKCSYLLHVTGFSLKSLSILKRVHYVFLLAMLLLTFSQICRLLKILALKQISLSVFAVVLQGKLLKPHIAKLVVALLESLSGLEPQVL